MGRRRGGFTLIEVIVAILFMAITLSMLAAFSVGTATQLVKLSQSDVRQAVTLREVNRLAALPFTALTAENGVCRTVTVADLAHTSCVTIANSAEGRTVTIVVRPPSGLTSTYADTIVLRRVPPAYNPLNTL
jgi:type II secretory pathway pseudopilin PulG